MADHLLKSLEIENFRVFDFLKIERLARVNLIVGKNNVGKSSVLEALRIYSSPTSIWELLEIAVVRDEFDLEAYPYNEKRGVARRYPIANLFHGRHFDYIPGKPIPVIRIEDVKSPGQKVVLTFHQDDERTLAGGLKAPIQPRITYDHSDISFQIPVEDAFEMVNQTIPNHKNVERYRFRSSKFLGPNQFTAAIAAELWDEIALTPVENDVIEGLRIVAPMVERLILKPIDAWTKIRVPFVKLKNQDMPVPLRSLGDGMSRIFGVTLALVNSRGGMVLLDEVENGLHYSVQPKIWKLIFALAEQLDVQVFATTHSYDCIRAFEEAAKDSLAEGIVIRLARKGEKTFVAEFDEEELSIAVEGQIEVR